MSDWYARNYPDGPTHDERCLAVLASWKRLYNIRGTGHQQRADGGFRKCGDGVEVRVRAGCLSTFDDDGLTRLVVAAHRLACRVEVSAAGRDLLVIRVHPRSHEGERFYDRHPTPDDLVKQVMT